MRCQRDLGVICMEHGRKSSIRVIHTTKRDRGVFGRQNEHEDRGGPIEGVNVNLEDLS